MANNRDLERAILGILGNIASCVFFLSSAPTVVGIVRRKSSGGLSGDLYVFKLFNCLLWTFYGLPFVHPHDFWVVLTNCLGCAFALIYIVPYFLYASKRERLSIIWKLSVILGSFLIAVVLLLTLDHSQHNRIMVVGILCVLVSSGMHMALLSQTDMAIRLKDTKYLHPNSSIAAFIKGSIWTAYGIVNLDVYIVIPNGVGVAIGLIQMSLVAVLLWSLRREVEAETGELVDYQAKIKRLSLDILRVAARDDQDPGDQPWDQAGRQRKRSSSSMVAVVVPLKDNDIANNDTKLNVSSTSTQPENNMSLYSLSFGGHKP